MAKIFTFRFCFHNPKTQIEDIVTFCAENEEEAMSLFKDFCLTDEKMTWVPDANIDLEYNKEDAEEYGEDYGSPDEYPDMKIHVTAYPFAIQDGFIFVPKNTVDVKGYIRNHWDDIRFGKPDLDYGDTEFEIYKA